MMIDESETVQAVARMIRGGWIAVFFGVISLSLVFLWTCLGRVWRLRYDVWIHRKENPREYWYEVAMYFGTSIAAFGYAIYVWKTISR